MIRRKGSIQFVYRIWRVVAVIVRDNVSNLAMRWLAHNIRQDGRFGLQISGLAAVIRVATDWLAHRGYYWSKISELFACHGPALVWSLQCWQSHHGFQDARWCYRRIWLSVIIKWVSETLRGIQIDGRTTMMRIESPVWTMIIQQKR